MRKTINLSDTCRDFTFAVAGMRLTVYRPNLLAIHNGNVGTIEIPTDTYDTALKPVGRVYSPAPSTNHPSTHAKPAFLP